jgi:hypothetical protein
MNRDLVTVQRLSPATNAGERKVRVRNSVRKFAILAGPLLFLTAFAAWAPSASAQTQVALYQYEGTGNYSTLPCLVYSGGALYMQSGCETQEPYNLNHAALWAEDTEGGTTYELENVHTPDCLTSTSSGPGVYMDSCGSNHVQWWEKLPVAGTTNAFVFQNVHTGDDLTVDGVSVWELGS